MATRKTNKIDGPMTSLPIYYNNVRSITNKRNICMKIELSPYKVLCLTETWMEEGIFSSVYFPDIFEVYRCDRKIQNGRRAGGVAILIHHTLRSKQINWDDTTVIETNSEFLAVELSIKPKPLVIYLCYMNTFSLEVALRHHKRIEWIVEKYRAHIIMVIGDFNLYDIVWSTDVDDENVYLPKLPHQTNDASSQNRSMYHTSALEFLDKMLTLPMFQLSNIQNRYTNVLDLVFVNETSEFRIREDSNTIVERDQQDPSHKPYEINVDYSAESSCNVEVKTIYCYKRGNYERLCAQLEAINFQHEFNMRDVDSAYEFFIRTVKDLVDRNVPTIRIKKYSNKPKWWTSELQHLKNRRDKLFKRKSDAASTLEYEQALNEFNELNDRLYQNHINRIQENIKSDPAEFWKFARINGGNDKYPSRMNYGDKTGLSTSEIVNLFAEYFESIYVRDEEPWEFEDIYTEMNNAVDVQVSLFDIDKAISKLKNNSGAGPDGLKPIVVKICSSAMVWPIWLLYRKSFEEGKIAKGMKMSRVVPVYKRKGDKSNVKNYRVVAIQPVVTKIHEVAVKSKLDLIIQPRISDAQHGFRCKRSVVTNLLNLSIVAYEAIEKHCQLDLCYGDFKTAFDKVWIRRLMMKFATFCVGKKTGMWLCEYFTGRTNYVQISGAISGVYESPSGVPPGSSLGPSAFTVFINDIVEYIRHVKPLLFADDIKLAAMIRDQSDVILMQRDVDNMRRWCDENRLYFNPEKCFVLSIYRDNVTFIDNTYTLGDHVIERKYDGTDLGLSVDRWFHLGQHIELMTRKCRQIVGCIKHYSNGNFTMETQRILYVAYVRSRLEFASTIWNPSSDVYKDDIESIQKQFVIHLLESRRNAISYRLAPYDDRCKQVKLQNLELRRKVIDAMLAYDIFKNNITDELISSKFVHEESEYDLRRSTLRLLKEPRYDTNYLSKQPIARLIRLVNEFKHIIRDCDNRIEFKMRVMDEIGLTDED